MKSMIRPMVESWPMEMHPWLLLVLMSLHAHAQSVCCERRLDLQPHEKVTIASTVLNDWVTYGSQVVEARGAVRTDDGANKLSSVWLLTTDIFRWGTNRNLQSSAGSVIEFHERVSLWGKGQAQIRVEAGNSPTHLCLCTRDEGAGGTVDAGYTPA
jgi:hypothetical protein